MSSEVSIPRVKQLILKDVGPFDDVSIRFPDRAADDKADVVLLTGPNGSGKSTILYAIAAGLGAGLKDYGLGNEHITRRLRSGKALAAVEFGSVQTAVVGYDVDRQLTSPFDSSIDLSHLHSIEHGGGYFLSGPSSRDVKDFFDPRNRNRLLKFTPPFTWAAFAYAGTRSIGSYKVDGIQAQTDGPFENSLSFELTASPKRFAEWYAYTEFERMKAKERGNVEKAETYRAAVAAIERIISKIVNSEVSFVMPDVGHNVRVKFDNREMEMDLLPEGLKSIISWIADLLMRLDRIPWAGDTPVLQRPFILLLDEIDIHLHPTWQRRILPMVQDLFTKAQIIATTHSPFVVGSVKDAHVIPLTIKDGSASAATPVRAKAGASFSTVIRALFDIEMDFDTETEGRLRDFYAAKARILAGDGNWDDDIQPHVEWLAARSDEVRDIIGIEVSQLKRQLKQIKTT